jgi:hypothetical protein
MQHGSGNKGRYLVAGIILVAIGLGIFGMLARDLTGPRRGATTTPATLPSDH